MRTLHILAAVLLAIVACSPSAPGMATDVSPACERGADHWGVVESPRIYRSAEPGRREFANFIRCKNIQTIVDLRYWTNLFGIDDEFTHELNGLRIIPIGIESSITATVFSRDKFIDALAVIRYAYKNTDGGILIHCSHGKDRTGAVSALYKLVFLKKTKEHVISEMEKFGFRAWFYFLKRWIENADPDDIRKQVEARERTIAFLWAKHHPSRTETPPL